jgi:hypothetical protein
MRNTLVAAITLLLVYGTAHSAQLTFIPRFSVQTEYTDNLFLTPEDEEKDIITTISAGFTAGITDRKGKLEVSYDPAYAFYKEFDENNGWRHLLSLTGRRDFTPFTWLDFSDSFVRTEDPLSEREIDILRGEIPPSESDPTVRKGREPYNRNHALVRLTHLFGRTDQFYLEYYHTLLKNDDNVFHEDSQSHNPSAGLTYRFDTRWSIDLQAAFTRGIFDQDDTFTGTSDFDRWVGGARLNRRFSRILEGFLRYTHTYQDFDEESEPDYQVYTPAVGIDYFIEEDIELLVELGYFYRDFKDPEVSDDNTDGLVFNADLIKTFRRGSFRLYAAGGVDETYFTSQNLGFTRYYMAGYTLDYLLVRRLRCDTYGLYRRSEYIDRDTQRDDDIYRFGVGLAYEPTQWMSIRLSYSFRKVDSNIDENDYTENRGLLRITLSPERPYRRRY